MNIIINKTHGSTECRDSGGGQLFTPAAALHNTYNALYS